MLITICDNESIQINEILLTISEWEKNQKRYETKTHVYQSAKNLMLGAANIEDYDLFFLDPVLPEMNGIELAKRIKKENPYCTIVFISKSDEFLEEGYEVPIYRYLRKPLKKEKISQCLDYAYEESLRNGTFFLYKKDGESFRVPVNSIKYVTSGVHSVTIHTDLSSMVVPSRLSFETFCDQFNYSKFTRCHRGYLVNLLYVEHYTPSCIYLRGENDVIPIGRKYHNETIRKLRRFV